jgi:hypothetical protein
MNITLKADDFTNLFDVWMGWGQDWKTQQDRFDKGISYEWKNAYWFEVFYSNLILAREYLKHVGHSFEITNDEAGGWVILTDYDYAVGVQ